MLVSPWLSTLWRGGGWLTEGCRGGAGGSAGWGAGSGGGGDGVGSGGGDSWEQRNVCVSFSGPL